MKEYIGFIVNAHYEIVEETCKQSERKGENESKHSEQKAIIHIYGRFKNGKSFEAITSTAAYFFIKKEDEMKAKKILHIETSPTELWNLKEEEVVKVSANSPKDVPKLRKLFEDHNIPCFEADIRFVRRYFIDKHILSTITIKGESSAGQYTDLYFDHPEISPGPKENPVEPTMLSFDIETDEEASKLYSISLYSKKIKKVFIVENAAIKKTKLKGAEVFKNEKELLQKFIEEVNRDDPDVLVGWHVIDFDLMVLAKKAKEYDLPFNLGRTANNSTLRINSSFFRDSSANCEGRVVLDGIQVLKSSFVKLDDYKLNTAAKHFLKDSKLITENNRGGIINKMYKEKPQKLVDYNLKDSELVFNIFHASKTFELTVQRSMLTGMRMDEVKASIASFDSLFLRALRKRNHVAPSTRSVNDEEGIGGFVMESKPGIYDQVIVLDFKSLYPSLMQTFNIDPLEYAGTVDEVKKKGENPADTSKYSISPNDAVFKITKEGILPQMLTELLAERAKAKKQKKDLSQYAIKILMNSMYGVLASRNSRFHIRNMSNSITSFAQFFIKLTAEELKKDGYDVIYGDTDSVFIDIKTKDTKEAEKIGHKIEKDLNEHFTKFIKEKYDRESMLELEFEKQFVKFFMPTVRGGEGGAKKRYAGLKLSIGEHDKKPVMDFTGLEFVRRDWTDVSKEFQLKLLNLVFSEKPVEDFVKKFVEDLKAGKYDELLVYRKSLRKKVEEYTKTTPPHVKAAKLLKKIESNLIEYVITKDGPQPVQNTKSALDYDHYIEKQIKPIANSVLELKGTTFEDAVKGSKQKGLGGFF